MQEAFVNLQSTFSINVDFLTKSPLRASNYCFNGCIDVSTVLLQINGMINIMVLLLPFLH